MMKVLQSDREETLQEYPCDYMFKAFGPSEPHHNFAQKVHKAVNNVLPVSHDALKQRPSSKGAYMCVSVVTYLHNEQQRQRIYQALQNIDGLKYLL
jgi:putative lipoic acid-binding regulatory protein